LKHCGTIGGVGGETLQDVMKRRALTQQDLLAAAKTYVPTGKRDDFLAFSSGGQSGRSSSTASPRCEF
jgi:nitrous-oxide reductase